MVCNVIEECRCYAYSDVTDPKQVQFVAQHRLGATVPATRTPVNEVAEW